MNSITEDPPVIHKFTYTRISTHTHRDALKASFVLKDPLLPKGVELVQLVIFVRHKLTPSHAPKASIAPGWGTPNRWSAIQVCYV